MADRRTAENAMLRAVADTDKMMDRFKTRFEGDYLTLSGDMLADAIKNGKIPAEVVTKLEQANPEAFKKFMETYGTKGKVENV